ncbi:MAG: peptidylprolyl isomerase [Saccharofermentanales bacterium]
MSLKKRKKEDEVWKSDQVRQERKERLARMKAKDGYKKPIRDNNKIIRIVSILVVVAIVSSFGVWFALKNGIRQRYAKAFTVRYDEDAKAEIEIADNLEAGEDQEESETADQEDTAPKGEVIDTITVAEANIYLGNISQQVLQGTGAFSQPGQDALSQPSMFNPQGTLRDDLLLSVEQSAKNSSYYYWKAKQEGLELEDSDLKQIDSNIEQLESVAGQSQVTLSHFLSVIYGPGVNESVLREFLEKNQLASKYVKQVYDTFTYDEATINQIYDGNPDAYNEVNYRSYLFAGQDTATDVPEDPAAEDSAEPAADMATAKKNAEEFAAKVTDEETFRVEADKLDSGDAESQDADINPETDKTLTKAAKKAYMTMELGEWLFSDERKALDKTVIEEDGGYRVVMFIEKYKPTEKIYDSRHILIGIDEEDPEKTDEKSKAKAEEILAEYEAGEKTAEAFADLAVQYSEDQGSVSNGGQYKGVVPGQFVPEYEAYCLDPARKPGDVEIVKTVHGYHIIYFEGTSEKWYSTIESELEQADQQEFLAEVDLHTNITQEKGVKYFGKP